MPARRSDDAPAIPAGENSSEAEVRAPEALDFTQLQAEIDKGLADIAAGRTFDADQVFRNLRERLK